MEERLSADPVGDLVTDLLDAIAATPGELHIGLTGGRAGAVISPAAVEALRDRRNAHVWFSDERFLPLGDSERNDSQLPADIGSLHVHRILGATPDEAAANYSAELHRDLTTRFCSDNTLLDVCILSIGPDGHIASLFPGNPALDSDAGVLAVLDSPKPPAQRVTLGYATLNASRQVWLIATGAEKSDAVEALRAGADLHAIPAAGVRGRSATRLYTDIA